MNENRERAEGKLQEVGGAIKEKVGDWTDNESMQAEGEADQVVGAGRQDVAKGVGRLKGAADEIGGNIKQAVGSVTGDDSLHNEGHVDEVKGDIRKTINQ